MSIRTIEITICNFCESAGSVLAPMTIRDYNDHNSLRVFFETIHKMAAKKKEPIPKDQTFLIEIVGVLNLHICLHCAQNKLNILTQKNNGIS